MRAQIVEGEVISSRRQAIVCPVNIQANTVLMAPEFLTSFAEECQTYKQQCLGQKLTVGDIMIVERTTPLTSKVPGVRPIGPKWIIFFPTVVHPYTKSSAFILLMGLQNMLPTLKAARIQSITLPPLGCGDEGMDFGRVHVLVDTILGSVPDLVVELLAPQ